jgi:hypothetical protein
MEEALVEDIKRVIFNFLDPLSFEFLGMTSKANLARRKALRSKYRRHNYNHVATSIFSHLVRYGTPAQFKWAEEVWPTGIRNGPDSTRLAVEEGNLQMVEFLARERHFKIRGFNEAQKRRDYAALELMIKLGERESLTAEDLSEVDDPFFRAWLLIHAVPRGPQGFFKNFWSGTG